MEPVRARTAKAEGEAAEDPPEEVVPMSDGTDRPQPGGEDTQGSQPHESLRLLCDLADALDAQARRADGLSSVGGAPLAPELLQAIAADAQRLKRRCDQLRRALASDSALSRPPAAPGLRTRRPPVRSRPAVDDARAAARTVAVDLKLVGLGPEEVSERLAEVVGEERAAALVEEVFAPVDPQPG
jgi:hypothetical protein